MIYPDGKIDEPGSNTSQTFSIVSWSFDQNTKVARIVLKTPFPPLQDGRRPILVQNHVDLHGIWKLKLLSEDGLLLSLHRPSPLLSDGNAQSFPLLPWTVIPTENESGFCIRESADFAVDISREAFVMLAPPLVFKARSTVHKICSVATIEQTFNADVYSELRLRSISLTSNAGFVEDCLKNYYLIDLVLVQFINADGDLEAWTSLSQSLRKDATATYYDYTYKVRFRGSFQEEFELQRFPFDEQELNMTLGVAQTAEWVVLSPNEEFPSTFQYSGFQLNNVYGVAQRDQVEAQAAWSRREESASFLRYPRVIYTLRLQRRSLFYVVNVMLPMMIIGYLAFLSFCVGADGQKLELGDRLSV
eukprot:gene46425-56855_t